MPHCRPAVSKGRQEENRCAATFGTGNIALRPGYICYAFYLQYREMVVRSLHTAFAVGIATALVGLSGPASAQGSNTHVMTVRLPGGGTAQISYTGNAAPRVSVSDAPAPLAAFIPMRSFFGPGSPFAALERISAEMDREAAAMLRQADLLAAEARSGQLGEAALHGLPRGGESYSFVSTLSGSGVCSQSVEITSQGNGAPPRVVRHSSGNCTALPGGAGSVNLPAAPATPATRPDVVWTSAPGAKPYAGLVREIPAGQR